jgi:peptide/nickel transport system ATP-binding protein
MESNVLLSVKNVTKMYSLGSSFRKRSFAAVDNVTFEIASSKPMILTLAGESGSGKTTLGNMILGRTIPTVGEILFRGVDVVRQRKRRQKLWFMRNVQPIFQNPFDAFSPLRKIDSYLSATLKRVAQVRDESERAAVMEKVLLSVGLDFKYVRKRYTNELSGGQIQRLSVARAIMCSPAMLVADEPVSMIDASLRMSIVNLLKDLKENNQVSVIYITHDLATAYYVSDRIGIMLRGNIVEMGPVDEVLDRPKHPYTQMLIESIPGPNPTKKWEEEISMSTLDISEYLKQGCKFADRCPKVMEVCRGTNPPEVNVNDSIVKCYLYQDQS